MKSTYRDRYDDDPNDPSKLRVPCAVCQTQIPLGEAHSVAVVYVGEDQYGHWRYTVCDDDQPFACSHEHALQAAVAYHDAAYEQKTGAWSAAPDHPPIEPHLPYEDACHLCGAARDGRHREVLVDYRCTGTTGVTPWHCAHVVCPDCMPQAVAACTREHLSDQFTRRLHPAERTPHAPRTDSGAPPERLDTPGTGQDPD